MDRYNPIDAASESCDARRRHWHVWHNLLSAVYAVV